MWRGNRTRTLVLGAVAFVVLAAASGVAVGAATGAFSHPRTPANSAGCRTPALPGAVVAVRLVDMRSMMGRRGMMGRAGMMGGRGPWLPQRDWPRFRHGMMRLIAAPTTVPHGTVSFRVTNTGYLTHELVVLPLRRSQPAGTRIPRPDGTVPETGSLGEASAGCASGAGDGISPGSTGWVTLHLPAGRYELVCNLPGHYAARMYAELDVR